jgi:hypothetical protein
MRTFLACLLLALPCLGGDEAVDHLVGRLFSADPAERAAAREELAALGDGALGKVLAALEARQTEAPVLRVLDVRDLQADGKAWGMCKLRIRQAAAGAEQFREASDGVLLVHATGAVHRRVEEELKALRRFTGRIVTMETRLARLATPLADVPAELGVAEAAALLKQHGAEVQASPHLSCRNGQKASMAITGQVAFVADFDVDAAEDAFVADPVVENVHEGMELFLRPVLGEDETIRIVVGAQVTDLAEPVATVTIPTPIGGGFKIQVPETRTTKVTKLVTCRPGRVAIVDLGGGTLLLLTAVASAVAD